jgi:hypothetical protein
MFWYYSQSALKVLSAKFNPFWKNVINVWASVRDDSSTAPEEILSQPIWHNGRIFIQKVFEKPLKSQNKWMTDLNITEEGNWDIIYQLPFKSILSTKLQSFQYKLNLRILYTNSMLMKFGLSETE